MKNDKNLILKDFVEKLEMTVMSDEDAVLLEGMVGTSGCEPPRPNNCQCNGNNCQCGGNNCNCIF